MGKEEQIKEYIFWGIIAGIILISYLILRDLLISIITAIVLAYIIKPLYERLEKKMNKSIAAISTILITLIVIFAALATFIGSFVSQLSKLLSQENITLALNYISTITDVTIIQENLPAILTKVGEALINLIPGTISYLPAFLLNLFVVFFTAYFVLIDWDRFEKKVADVIPFKNKNEIIDKIKKRTRSIVNGTFLIALIEAVVAGIGLWILGVEPFLVLGILVGLLAFIPALGPTLVWLPLAIIEFFYGEYYIMAGV